MQDDKNYFRSEAALLQQLHHPRVVLLMGVCSTAARPFMLLEYMMGGSLHTLIHGDARSGSLFNPWCARLSYDARQRLLFVHSQCKFYCLFLTNNILLTFRTCSVSSLLPITYQFGKHEPDITLLSLSTACTEQEQPSPGPRHIFLHRQGRGTGH